MISSSSRELINCVRFCDTQELKMDGFNVLKWSERGTKKIKLNILIIFKLYLNIFRLSSKFLDVYVVTNSSRHCDSNLSLADIQSATGVYGIKKSVRINDNHQNIQRTPSHNLCLFCREASYDWRGFI